MQSRLQDAAAAAVLVWTMRCWSLGLPFRNQLYARGNLIFGSAKNKCSVYWKSSFCEVINFSSLGVKAKFFYGLIITILHRRDAGFSVFSLCGLLLGVMEKSAQYGLFSHVFTQWECLATLCLFAYVLDVNVVELSLYSSVSSEAVFLVWVTSLIRDILRFY